MNTSLLTRPEQHVSLVRPSEITALVQRCLPSWGRSEARYRTPETDGYPGLGSGLRYRTPETDSYRRHDSYVG